MVTTKEQVHAIVLRIAGDILEHPDTKVLRRFDVSDAIAEQVAEQLATQLAMAEIVDSAAARIPELSDREAVGLEMIRTGNVTSVSKAEAADRWIDRVLAVRRGEPMNTDAVFEECRTCIGHGQIRDGETNDLRRCLDCGGDGLVPAATGK